MPEVWTAENPLGALYLIADGKLVLIDDPHVWSQTLDRVTTIAISSAQLDFSLSWEMLLALLNKKGEVVTALRLKSYVQGNAEGKDEIISLYTFYRSRFPTTKQ